MTQGLETQGPMGLSHALVVAQGLQGSLEAGNHWSKLGQSKLNTQEDSGNSQISIQTSL